MDEKIKTVLIAALNVAAGRNGDVSTEDGCFSTCTIDDMIELETAFCAAFDTKSDDVIASEILPKIRAL